MFPNLRAEMARKCLKTADISTALGIAEKSANNKMMGRTEFTIAEALKIRDVFFPALQIDYLFEKIPKAG